VFSPKMLIVTAGEHRDPEEYFQLGDDLPGKVVVPARLDEILPSDRGKRTLEVGIREPGCTVSCFDDLRNGIAGYDLADVQRDNECRRYLSVPTIKSKSSARIRRVLSVITQSRA